MCSELANLAVPRLISVHPFQNHRLPEFRLYHLLICRNFKADLSYRSARPAIGQDLIFRRFSELREILACLRDMGIEDRAEIRDVFVISRLIYSMEETIIAPKRVQKLACKTALHSEMNFFP